MNHKLIKQALETHLEDLEWWEGLDLSSLNSFSAGVYFETEKDKAEKLPTMIAEIKAEISALNDKIVGDAVENNDIDGISDTDLAATLDRWAVKFRQMKNAHGEDIAYLLEDKAHDLRLEAERQHLPWDVEITQVSIFRDVEAPTQEEAIRKVREDYTWGDNVVRTQSICTPYEN
tara:strand:- start:139 stop:663 length:525 start_codon:yes stop_codon:yes gene_type:complete